MKNGFKILARSTANRTLWSITTHSRVRYKIGKPARPKPGCGPLAVFDTKAHAEFFLACYPSFEEEGNAAIYPCTYKPSKSEFLWCITGGIRENKIGLPDGTDLASVVIVHKEPKP